MLAAPAFATLLLWSFKLLIDEVLVAGRTDLLPTFVAIYVFATTAKILVDFATQRLEASTIESVVLALRADLYAHVLSLSPGSIPKETTGDILARLQGDTDRTEYLIFTGPLAVLADGAASIIFFGFLAVLDWRLALITLVALPIIVVVVQNISPHVRKASKLSRRAESLWMSLAEERLAAKTLVQAFNAEAIENRAFRRRCSKVRRMQIASLVLQARQSALVEATVAVAGLGVLGAGAALISSGQLTVGALIAFIGAVGSLYQPVRSLAKVAGRFQSAAAGAQRVAALMDCPSAVQQLPGARSLDLVRGAVSFRNVHFAYPGCKEIVRGVTLDINAGETVALVGPSGSGKTSLLRLLMRQYDVNEGAVLIDGHNVKDLRLEVVRNVIGPVFQDATVLNGSIKNNISYGLRGVDDMAIDAAAQAAAVEGFAAAKSGLLTTVGTWGGQLSGGQRQRVALARALLRDAPILLLDEATAGVDSETEEHIQRAIDRIAGQRTIIIVAHRLSTVRSADRVVVIDDGRIVEQGHPTTLLSRASRCRELFAAQIVVQEAAE